MLWVHVMALFSLKAIVPLLASGALLLSTPAVTAQSLNPATLSGPSLSLSNDKAGVSKQHRGETKQRARSQLATVNPNFWVYDAITELRFDSDGDGHYTRLIVEFDVDTAFILADVYARLYLSRDLGPWNEYAVTDDFSIFSAGGDDSYVLESDLVEGFPFGYYDVLIEIYDTFDNSLVAEFGPADSAQLSELPLEDELSDGVGERIVVSSGGGGSLSSHLLLILGLLVLLQRIAVRRFAVARATFPQDR